jgi:hypothetical protein
MAVKRVENCESAALSPRKTRAARLRLNCLKPNPDWLHQAPSYAGYRSATASDEISCLSTEDLSVGYREMNPGVRMSGQPNPRYSATPMNFRIAYGARALRRRSHRSSPRTGKPSTWRRVAGDLRRDQSWRYA